MSINQTENAKAKLSDSRCEVPRNFSKFFVRTFHTLMELLIVFFSIARLNPLFSLIFREIVTSPLGLVQFRW